MSNAVTGQNSNHQPSALAEQFRLAMRRQAASVSVVTTTDDNGSPLAMTATSVTSVSMNPPSLLICVNQWASIFQPLTAGRAFCVNILAIDQQQIADNCSRGQDTRNHFTTGIWKTGPENLPFLENAQASLFCYNDESMCYATHTVFIGRIQHVLLHGEVAPLIYLNGEYLPL